MMEIKNLYVSPHPLVAHYLTMMRDEACSGAQFRQLMNKIAECLVYEAMLRVPVPVGAVEGLTPTGFAYKGSYIDSSAYALISLMRTGMNMASTVHSLLPNAIVGHAGYHQQDETMKPFYMAIPDLSDRVCLVFESGIVSGKSLAALLQQIIEVKGARPGRIAVVSIIASKPGVQFINDQLGEHEVPIYAAACDPDIVTEEDTAYAKPGVGSFQERMFGCLIDATERVSK